MEVGDMFTCRIDLDEGGPSFLEFEGGTQVADELHKKIEHAAHEGEDSSRLPQLIGITVAVLGVLMAMCSAQVGAARTALIATMVEESAAKAKYTAVAHTYRNLQGQLQQLHAAMPDLDYQKKKNEELKKLYAEVKNPDTKQSIQAAGLNTDKILNTVTPTESDMRRFLGLLPRTRAEVEAAKRWSESYRDAVQVHDNTAARFALALVGAEVGIVIASVGLVLVKKRMFAQGAWGIAIALGFLSIGVVAFTTISNRHALNVAQEKIQASEHDFTNMNKDAEDIDVDKSLERDILDEFKEMKKSSAAP
jgi:hypothetical protein